MLLWTGKGFVTLDKAETITAKKVFQPAALSNDNSMQIARDANYAGGTAGWVNSALRLDVAARAGTLAYEWAFCAVMQNEAGNGGENVAIYGQGNKKAAGAKTWAGCFEARDHTNGDNAGNFIGIEVDVFANGPDTVGGSRVGIDLVAGKGIVGGAKCEVFAGVRLGPCNGVTSDAKFINGIKLDGDYTTGINLSGITSCTNAIKLKENQSIAFDAAGNVTMKYNSTSGNIEFYNGSTLVGHIQVAGGADHAL